MNQSMLWIIILTAGLGTFLLRYSFLELMNRYSEPPWLARILRYVPPAVLAALVSSALLIRDGSVYFAATNNRLLAGALAAAVAWKTRNMLYTIIAGMITLFLLSTVTA